VIATGHTHTVREFCELAFGSLKLDYRDYVRINPAFVRPAEVDLLVGNASKARERLGWSATTDLAGLVKMMIDNDLRDLANGSTDYPRPFATDTVAARTEQPRIVEPRLPVAVSMAR
jgi:hypothetical protein